MSIATGNSTSQGRKILFIGGINQEEKPSVLKGEVGQPVDAPVTQSDQVSSQKILHDVRDVHRRIDDIFNRVRLLLRRWPAAVCMVANTAGMITMICQPWQTLYVQSL